MCVFGSRVEGSRFLEYGCGPRVASATGFGFRVSGIGIRVWVCELRIPRQRLGVSGYRGRFPAVGVDVHQERNPYTHPPKTGALHPSFKKRDPYTLPKTIEPYTHPPKTGALHPPSKTMGALHPPSNNHTTHASPHPPHPDPHSPNHPTGPEP